MPILSLQSVSYHVGARAILETINLDMEARGFLSIIGPNGGGKSTLLKLIMGVISPSNGRIEVFGLPPKQGRSKVGFLAQYPEFESTFPITVEECVALGTLQNRWRGYFTKADYHDAHYWLDRVGMGHISTRSLRNLSGGERQRVFLARALVNRPELLILDEPTASVDSQGETQFYDILAELNQDMAIVMVSHDLSAVSSVSQSVACLNRTLVYHGGPELEASDIDGAYHGCAVDLIAHGHPHRVFRSHGH